MYAIDHKRIACIRIPNFCWQAEACRRPFAGEGRPALVTGTSADLPGSGFEIDSAPGKSKPASDRIVLDCSPGLPGVVPGMPLAEAVSRHKGATLIQADLPHYTAVFEAWLDALERVVPDVENAGPGTAYVGIWGLEGLYGDDANVVRVLASAADGFDLRIGVGENKWLAFVASNLSRPGSAYKVTGEPGRFLNRFPVDSLPVPYEAVQRLHGFGLGTMGAVSELPQGPMEAQFGPVGRVIWKLANGIDDRPLIPRHRVETVSEHLSFPDATVSLSTIVSGIESLLTRAFSKPRMLRRYARNAELQAQVFRKPPWTMRVAFKDPVGSKSRALFGIKTKLDTVEIPGPLEDMRLTLAGLSSEGWRQESMWKEVQEEDNLRQAVSQLRARLGVAPPIYQIRDLEPWSRIPERRHALVQITP